MVWYPFIHLDMVSDKVMRKTTIPDHHKERNKQRKTKPQAIHHHNPSGTKFARQILERTYTKEKALKILGL